MNKTRFIILSVFLLVFASSVTAPGAVTTNINSANGLQIKVPIYDYIITFNEFDFNVHLFNISNGLPIDNSSTKCVLHVYNQSGDHIYGDFMSHDTYAEHFVTNEWVSRLNRTIFSSSGEYNFITQCNSSSMGIGGFYSDMLIVRDNEGPSTTQSTNVPAIIFTLIAIAIVFFIIALMQKELKLQIMFYSVTFIQILMLSFLIYAIEKGSSIVSLLYVNFWVMLILIFGIGIYSLFALSVQTIDPSEATEDNEGSTEKKKWS